MKSDAFAAHLFSTYDQYVVESLTPTGCVHGAVQAALRKIFERTKSVFTMEQLGPSLEGRPITAIRFGSGAKQVLIWSQMHGDEPTGTLGLVDMLHFLSKRVGQEGWIDDILEEITVVAVPMLNPDGAERMQRPSGAHIDLNRDALLLATPESRILKNLHQQIEPAFAIHLHDQELSSVGSGAVPVALALLVPPMGPDNSLTSTRLRAMSVGALLVSSLTPLVGDHLATYDDTHEPRAFGDSMQAWGTSTLLIESGHWPGDIEKRTVRKLNFVALLVALRGIGDGSYQSANLELYTSLKKNGKRMFDIIVRGVLLQHPTGWSHRVDIGLMLDPPFKPRVANTPSVSRNVIVKEVGDLSTHSGLEIIDAHRKAIASSAMTVDGTLTLAALEQALTDLPEA